MNKKEVLFLSICVFLTVIAWLVADIVHTSSSKQLDEDIEQVAPVEPIKLDSKIFELLEQKK
jgi:hypothetical protein